MESLFLAYAAITIALLIVQLLDYVGEQERVLLSGSKVLAFNNGLTGVESSPAAAPQVQYGRAA